MQKMVQNDKKLSPSCCISQEAYLIWLSFMVHMCKMICPGVFFNFKILIFQVVKGLKGQKMVENIKNFCLLHLIFQEPCIKWSFFYGTHVYIREYLQAFFSFFFLILIFAIIRWGVVKRQKMAQNDQKFCLSHSVSQEPNIIQLWFLMHVCEMMISPANVFIFQNFDFWHFQRDKGQKMT